MRDILVACGIWLSAAGASPFVPAYPVLVSIEPNPTLVSVQQNSTLVSFMPNPTLVSNGGDT